MNKIFEAYRQIIGEAQTVTQTVVNKQYTVKVKYVIPGDPNPKEMVLPLSLPANATNITFDKPQ